ncbi:MAG: helix-turn-helix domain-containing protein [Pseudonocardiaceae bacterium]
MYSARCWAGKQQHEPRPLSAAIIYPQLCVRESRRDTSWNETVETVDQGTVDHRPGTRKIAARLRDRYAQGASIRELMAQTGRSYGWTHRLLRESGAVLHGRGAHPRGKPTRLTRCTERRDR